MTKEQDEQARLLESAERERARLDQAHRDRATAALIGDNWKNPRDKVR